MADTVDLLKDRLSSLPEIELEEPHSYESLHSNLEQAAVDILNIIGHVRDNIFVDLNLEIPPRAKNSLSQKLVHFPAIAAHTAASPPQVAITTTTRNFLSKDLLKPTKLEGSSSQYLLNCDVTSRAKYTVMLNRNAIAILGQEYPPKAYPLEHLDDEHVEEMIDKLKPPEEYPQGQSGKFPAGYHPNQTKLTRWLFGDSDVTPEYLREINKKFFSLNIDKYSQMLYDAYSADSNQQKGSLLEDVVEYLFENISLVSIRDRNLRTKSGEIDLILEYAGGETPNLFEYQSRFILIECKNLEGSVSSKEVGHFEKKITKYDTSLGILIAWNGISGQDSGHNAQRYVDTSDCDIVVLTAEDLYQILNGKSLYKLLDEKLYSLRFDL